MRARTITAGLATAAISAGILLTPATAMAASTTGPHFTAAQAKAVAAIDTRLRVLGKDTASIAAAKHLSATDRSTLAAVLVKDSAGLTALRTKLLTDTSRPALATDASTIYTGYRVFLLLQPQIRDVIAADSISAGAQQVTAAADALAQRLGASITPAQSADLSTANTSAAAATSAVNGEVAAIVALSPAMVTKTLRPAELSTARTDDKTARTQLVAARTALAAAHPNVSATATTVAPAA